MTPERSAVLDNLAELILAVERSHPVRVGIDGVSAAGKTTLADELATNIERAGRPVIRVSADDFHNPGSVRYARGRLSPEGYYLDSNNHAAFRRNLLIPLGPSGSLRYRTVIFDSFHNFPEGIPVDQPEQNAAPNAVLLCDCIFAFRPELNDCWDFRIFLDAPFEETFRRGLLRDAPWMGSLAETRRRYEQRYIPGEQIYLKTVRPKELANVTLDNRDPQRPQLILGATAG